MNDSKYLRVFEKTIIVYLIVVLALVVLLAAAELGWIIIQDIISAPLFLLDVSELLDIFGLFLLVLIGIELLETVTAYLSKRRVHVEVVFIVAMIAVARKVIILDVDRLSSLTLIGIAAIIISLAASYRFIKQKG